MLQGLFEQPKRLYKHSVNQKYNTKQKIQSKAFEKPSQKEVPQVKTIQDTACLSERNAFHAQKWRACGKNLPHLACVFITEHTLSQALTQYFGLMFLPTFTLFWPQHFGCLQVMACHWDWLVPVSPSLHILCSISSM